MKSSNVLLILCTFLMLSSCNKNPFTGKSNLALVPNSKLFPMAFNQYDDFLDDHKVIKGTKDAQMVKRVGQNIARAAQQYLNAEGKQGYLKDYKWAYNLVNSDEVNAWCMPGGKIVVYDGILPITKNETGLAVVLGHEVSHALLNHGQQRMSQSEIQQLGAVAGNAALNGSKYSDIFNKAYGIGTQVGVMLPYSRKYESQADKLGLTLMAIAGYDPDEAVQLWQRMSQQSKGKEPPEFLSTHPSNQTRINNIKGWVGEAKSTAKKFGVTSFKK